MKDIPGFNAKASLNKTKEYYNFGEGLGAWMYTPSALVIPQAQVKCSECAFKSSMKCIMHEVEM